MRAARVYRCEAVVLKAYDYGEADKIITFVSPFAGKLRAIAKGVRRTKSRMSGHLDLFTRSSLLLARGRQLDLVTQAETIENFRPIRDDLARSTYSHYVAELVDGFSVENLSNQPLYDLTLRALRHLCQAEDLALAARAFELQLLGLTGYRPQLHRCLNCSQEVEPQINRFSARMGGVLCPGCAGADTAAPIISVRALKVMRNLQTNESATLAVSGLDQNIHHELALRLQEYVTYRLERTPRSLGFIERLRAESVVP